MERVYHYTSIESFQKMIDGIFRDGKDYYLTFWATSIYAMNDPMEFLHGYNLLKDNVLPDIEKELCITENSFKLSHIWNIIVKETTPSNGIDYLINHIYDNHLCPFIISFSKKKDFLPMWNAYSDKGKGVCLCFNNNEYLYKDDQPIILNKLHAMDVTYKIIDDVSSKTIKNFYNDYYQTYKRIPDEPQRTKKMIDYLISLIVVFSAYHKNEAYQYEEESRLVIFKHNESDVHYRLSKNGRLISYIKENVKLKHLEEIIVGPCADSEYVIRELKNQLHRYGIKDVTPSNVPYREF